MKIKAFHGGSLEGARWYTTDRDHAAYFGPVVEVELESEMDLVDVDGEVLLGAGGYEADARLWAHLEEVDATWARVTGWEGNGACIVVREPHYVTVEEA